MKEIKITPHISTMVDNEDFDIAILFRWYLDSGYARTDITFNGKKQPLYLHRLIANTPERMFTDHINNIKLDNRRSNLRICSKAENCRHRKKQKGSFIYKGVSWYGRTHKWKAQIKYNNIKITLGYFKTEIGAAKAYNEAALKYHREFATINDLKELK